VNPEQLLTHFDRISEAPDAIPRLRRFILDLAVRGKLVEQDPRDEPAGELLKQIQEEKARLVKEGVIKSYEPLSTITEAEEPFHLPAGWEWRRFAEIAAIQSNLINPRDYKESPHIAPDNIESGTGRLLPYETIGASAVFSSKHLFYSGCILYSKIRPALAKAVIVDFDGLCSADMYPILPLLNRKYLHRYMLTKVFIQQSISEDTRVAMPKINQASLSKILVAVPPLAEQHRIVTKVDELMALCDRLEAAQVERESRRDRLVASSLDRLNNGTGPDAFRDHARFYFSHLPRLTTRIEHIQQLRQTILNLAVRGKLVPQDPNDEPASKLLKRINAEQEELIKTRVLKPNGEDSQSLEEDLTFDLPQSWQWAPLSSIIVFGPQNGLSPKPSSRPDAPRAITLTATTSGQFNPQHFKRVEANILPDSEFWLRSGDLLFQRGNTREYVGIAAYYTGEPRLFLYPDLMMKVRVSQKASLRYVHLWAIAPPARTYFSTHATGAQATMPKINQGTLLQLPVPIPPLAEQQRIVAKVEKLMALCGQLEAQLTTTQSESRHLLEAVLHEALVPAV
jgi:type I restriction enzyme, S subunit